MARVQVHGEKFEDMIGRRGRLVLWREALACSCWNLDSGQPNYDCAACDGVGYIYQSAVECRVLLQSLTFSKEFDEFAGSFEAGDAVLSVGEFVPQIINGRTSRTVRDSNPAYRIGMHDIIILTDDEWKTSEVLRRGRTIGKRAADTLLNNIVTKMICAIHANPTTGTITHYYPDTVDTTNDFTINDDLIVWNEGRGPADGVQYSVVYMHRPVFIVLTALPTPRHQDNQNLPRRVTLRHRAGGFDKVQP